MNLLLALQLEKFLKLFQNCLRPLPRIFLISFGQNFWEIEICQKIVEASNAARQEKAVKLKYVLPAITVSGTKEVADAAKNLEEVLKKAANVKHVKTGASGSIIIAKPNWAVAGKKFGQDIKKLNEELQKA